jgi:hypothetical protein
MLTTVTWRMAADISIWYAPSGVYVHACQTRSPFSAYPIQRPGALVRRAAADLTRAPRDWPLARPPTVQTRSEKRIAVTCIARCALSADCCRDRRRGEFTSPRPTVCWPCWVEPNQWNRRPLALPLGEACAAFGGPVTLRVRVCTRCRLAGRRASAYCLRT